MRKGSGVSHVDTHIKIPDGIYEKLEAHKRRYPKRSVNMIIIAILEAHFSKVEETVTTEK